MGDSVTQDPTAWFDQFPPLAGSVLWQNSQWCPRHWAPCPILGANGIGAAVAIINIWINELKPKDIQADDVGEWNRALEADSPVCCKLGDERMYELWGQWPPSGGGDER